MAKRHPTTKTAAARATRSPVPPEARLRTMIETLDALDEAVASNIPNYGLELSDDDLRPFAEMFGVPYVALAVLTNYFIDRKEIAAWDQWPDRELFLKLLDERKAE